MPLFRTLDGSDSILSEHFGAAYHSKFGAVTESAHVFITNGLKYKAGQGEIAILEAGFGSGLNAFMTWLEAEKTGLQVKYLGLEAFPLSLEAASGLNFPAILKVPERTADFLKLHDCAWDTPVELSPFFHFEKRRVSILDFQAKEVFDLIYFDAFDPQVQPELWTVEVMKSMFDSLRPLGVLVTYCSQGAFRRSLKQAGFKVDKLPGVQGKWEITRAIRPPVVSRV